jgi:LysM repeat protein
MRAPVLITTVTVLHVAAIGAILFIQGCGTTQPGEVEPPPAPVMPPRRADPGPSVPARVDPVLVESTAPEMAELEDVRTYTVKKGDMLSKIAKRFGVSTRELAEINGITDPNTIVVGQELVLPAYASRDASERPRTPTDAAPGEPPPPGQIYVVQKGDTLSGIAVRAGTTVQEIKALNDMTSDKILIDQKIRLPRSAEMPQSAPPPPPSTRAPEPRPIPAPDPEPAVPSAPVSRENPEAAPETQARPDDSEPSFPFQVKPYPYTVSEGETLEDVAKAFVVSPKELMELNDMSSEDDLRPGQEILIPPPEL